MKNYDPQDEKPDKRKPEGKGQGDLFGEPRARARNSDPETSHAAAASISSEKLRKTQALVLGLFLEHGPMTDSDVAERAEGLQSPSGLRTRRSELVNRGAIIDTGEVRILESGRRSTIWAALEWSPA